MRYKMLAVGLDAGGTSTRAVLTTATGECVGYGVGGRGNPTSAGPERAADGVLDAITQALECSGNALSDVAVVTAAMAGADSGTGEDGWLLGRLVAEGFTGRLTFEADLLAAYYSASTEDFGYAIVSGTGAAVIRVAGGQIEAVGDALGWLLGDRGSGFWIGRRVARAVVQDLDGTGPATAMTPELLDRVGIKPDAAREDGRSTTLQRLVTALYSQPPIELAALAPLAFTAGDPVAKRILVRAGEHLADTLQAVLTGPGPVAVGGGVLSRPGRVRKAFIRRLGDAAATLELRSVKDGAVGAGLLALRAGGVAPTPEIFAALTESVERFR